MNMRLTICLLVSLVGCAAEDDLAPTDISSSDHALMNLSSCLNHAMAIYREDNNACPGGSAYAACLEAATQNFNFFVDYCMDNCAGGGCW